MNGTMRLSLCAAVACLLLPATPVWAQGNTAKVKIDKAEARSLASPDFPGARRTAPNARATEDWLQFLLEYKTTNGSGKDSKGDRGWQDEVVVEWDILIKRKDDKDILLKRSVTYLDVEDKRGTHFADLYLRPTFIRRYCKDLKPRDVIFRVQVKINGKTEDRWTSDREPGRWWEAEPPKVLIRNDELLTRDQTPFAPLDYDSYEHQAPSERK